MLNFKNETLNCTLPKLLLVQYLPFYTSKIFHPVINSPRHVGAFAK